MSYLRTPKFLSVILAAAFLAAVVLAGCNRNHTAVVSETEPSAETETEITEQPTTAATSVVEPYAFHQFQDSILSAKKKNADVVGWVYARNTLIDYPVYQYTDNSYYLKRNGSKSIDINGAIFADYRCKFNDLSQNTVLFGHNMLSGKMFGSQKNYADRDFLEKNPILEFSTSDKDRQWKIFAVYYIEPTFNYFEPNPSKELFQKILGKAREKDLFRINNVEVREDDKILTLSTCAPRSMGDIRFVVMARLLRDGESYELTFDTADTTDQTAAATAAGSFT